MPLPVNINFNVELPVPVPDTVELPVPLLDTVTVRFGVYLEPDTVELPVPLLDSVTVRFGVYLELPAHGVQEAIGATNWICPNAVALRESVNAREIAVTSSGEVTALNMLYATMIATEKVLASAEASCGGRECLAEAG